MPDRTQNERLLELVRGRGMVRARDLDGSGIPRVCLVRLHRQGLLDRPERGLYALAGAAPTEHHSLAEACKRVPAGVVCLLSALRFHGLTTQAPFEVWLTVDRKGARPREGNLPLRVVRCSARALAEGVEIHEVEGVPVRVTSPARTVADCFAYRHKVGLDVAMEALRDCLGKKLATADELYRAAKARRAARVLRPYLEALA